MRAVVYSPDMTMLATGGSDDSEQVLDSLKIWDAKIGSYHSSIRTWSTTTWKQIAVLGEHSTDPVDSIAISPNGRILASASWDKTARLWNLDNNQPIDGKLLATGCDDNNAYTWDVSGILKEAGLSELLLDKPVLAADATPRPVRQPIIVPQRRVPHGFFDDLPDRAQHASHPSTLRDRLFSLFYTDVHDTSSRPRPFHWVRLSGRPTGEDIELCERASGVVNVPYAKGKRRNASARERRMKIPPLKPGNSAARASLPPNSNTTQHSNGASQAQAAVSTVTAPLVVTNTTPNTNPHVIIRHAGCWTRFWLSMCCSSSEYTDGYH
ncbi:quinon protein alcohol dehydrogenase-like superfamily [Suillus fuscotomentosus]|uniref:Quinon protein alcohol dehydrogenase-like superfamily n=1 Tax=Suillus fuscotomentosus TaxID=1912939 RepID=A0AAD4EHH0_9AGAM|nr:quinon protein alcohol dehydrogenase-like superfamily [Suillus fuscotomentosus]KAG1905058.1 quinon protein alcohol dehydrogenase-like superfamily [Suillus fuscotomentosus]